MDDYSQMVSEKCYIETTDGDKFEGTIQAASAMGVLVKPKGTSTPRLIAMEDLANCERVPEEPSTLRQRRLDPITAAKARRHLLDVHGWLLSVVNTMDADGAEAAHAEADHDDLGHNHEGRKKNETEDDE